MICWISSIVVGVWIAKCTKWRERRERDFVIFAGLRGFRDPKAHEATAVGGTAGPGWRLRAGGAGVEGEKTQTE